ncbi:MAG: molybdenum cofactor guanylyltransferase [Porticoccaceae bacterium]|nr:molybdenum cofactor guanylyltransferase [Porticoccaceae bacterium]
MNSAVDGVILAAGRSSRMASGNKLRAQLAGRGLLERVAERFSPQVSQLVINLDSAFTDLPYPIVEDAVDGFRGPLVGLFSALMSPHLSTASYLAMVPCDGPFLPNDLVVKLYRAITAANAPIACARYAGVAQPTFSVWRKDIFSAVERALFNNQNGGFKPLMSSFQTVYVDWPKQTLEPFFNINSDQDLAQAERLLCD